MAAKDVQRILLGYKQVFERADLDGDRRIDFEEFVALLGSVGIQASRDSVMTIFNGTDKNKDSKIDFEEFKVIAPKLGLPSMKDVYRREFEKMEWSGDGLLDVKELQFGLMNMNKFMKSPEVIAMIDKVDVNKDGKVSFEEFMGLVDEIFN